MAESAAERVIVTGTPTTAAAAGRLGGLGVQVAEVRVGRGLGHTVRAKLSSWRGRLTISPSLAARTPMFW